MFLYTGAHLHCTKRSVVQVARTDDTEKYLKSALVRDSRARSVRVQKTVYHGASQRHYFWEALVPITIRQTAGGVFHHGILPIVCGAMETRRRAIRSTGNPLLPRSRRLICLLV